MKKFRINQLTYLFYIILSVLVFTSCGKDGEDGNAYVSINYSGQEPVAYWDDNYDVPSPFYWGREYMTRGGVYYNYEYVFYNGKGWIGTNYIYTPFEGSTSGFLEDGEDGEDSYSHFYCSYSGGYSDDGWRDASNKEVKDTTFNKDGLQIEINVIYGIKDTIEITQRINNRVLSVNRKWRKDRDTPFEKPNKLR